MWHQGIKMHLVAILLYTYSCKMYTSPLLIAQHVAPSDAATCKMSRSFLKSIETYKKHIICRRRKPMALKLLLDQGR